MTSADAWLVFGAAGGGAHGVGVARLRAGGPAAIDALAAAGASRASLPSAAAAIAAPHGRIEVATLAFAYGISGFGYIVTATFLPVIARASLPPASPLARPVLADLRRWRHRRRVARDAGAHRRRPAPRSRRGLRPAGDRASPSASARRARRGFALGSFLLGLPFTAITYFALQEVRRLRPLQIASTTGLVTVVWSIGQAAGPPMVALLLRRGGAVDSAFTSALAIAAAALVVGALVFLASARIWPRAATR